WLVGGPAPGGLVAALFANAPRRKGANPTGTELLEECAAFVTYRNDALGHGAKRSDAEYETNLRTWLPFVRRLLDSLAGLWPWRLVLPTDLDRAQVWMGPSPGTATEPGVFPRTQVGHFVLRGPEGQTRDLDPFLSYLPGTGQAERLHFYDALHRYKGPARD